MGNRECISYFALLCVLVNLFLSSTLGHECNYPYTKLATGCYYFSGNRVANWWKAAEVCRALGGVLAVINDPVENDAIRQHLIEAKPERSSYIGGYDLGHEGLWYWESTRQPIGFFGWYEDQPKNYEGNEHCIELWHIHEFQWNDGPCTNEGNSFICEADPKKKEIVLHVNDIKVQIEPAQQFTLDNLSVNLED